MKLQTAFLSFALLSVGMVSSNGGKQTQSSNAQGIEIRHVKSLSDATGIEMLDMKGSKVDVYDVNGRIVKSKAGSLDGLPHGIYVVGGKKIIK